MSVRNSFITGWLALLLAACAGQALEPQAVGVEVNGLKYQPASLEVTAGQPVRITLTNLDALEHDLSIMEFPVVGSIKEDAHGGHEVASGTEKPDLHVGVAANGTSSVEFTPSKPGTYEFFCTVAGHKEAGMVGSLVVNAPE